MAEKSREQKQRLSAFIEKMIPNGGLMGRLMKNLADEQGDFSKLSELSDDELKELITLEREYLGG